jgi:hypothetical protein
MKFALALIAILIPTLAGADSFYPACLKPDGDWLHGVTRKECVSKDLRGRWYGAKTMRAVRHVW